MDWSKLDLRRVSALKKEVDVAILALQKYTSNGEISKRDMLVESIEMHINHIEKFHTAYDFDERAVLFEKQRLRLRQALQKCNNINNYTSIRPYSTQSNSSSLSAFRKSLNNSYDIPTTTGTLPSHNIATNDNNNHNYNDDNNMNSTYKSVTPNILNKNTSHNTNRIIRNSNNDSPIIRHSLSLLPQSASASNMSTYYDSQQMQRESPYDYNDNSYQPRQDRGSDFSATQLTNTRMSSHLRSQHITSSPLSMSTPLPTRSLAQQQQQSKSRQNPQQQPQQQQQQLSQSQKVTSDEKIPSSSSSSPSSSSHSHSHHKPYLSLQQHQQHIRQKQQPQQQNLPFSRPAPIYAWELDSVTTADKNKKKQNRVITRNVDGVDVKYYPTTSPGIYIQPSSSSSSSSDTGFSPPNTDNTNNTNTSNNESANSKYMDVQIILTSEEVALLIARQGASNQRSNSSSNSNRTNGKIHNFSTSTSSNGSGGVDINSNNNNNTTLRTSTPFVDYQRYLKNYYRTDKPELWIGRK